MAVFMGEYRQVEDHLGAVFLRGQGGKRHIQSFRLAAVLACEAAHPVAIASFGKRYLGATEFHSRCSDQGLPRRVHARHRCLVEVLGRRCVARPTDGIAWLFGQRGVEVGEDAVLPQRGVAGGEREGTGCSWGRSCGRRIGRCGGEPGGGDCDGWADRLAGAGGALLFEHQDSGGDQREDYDDCGCRADQDGRAPRAFRVRRRHRIRRSWRAPGVGVARLRLLR